MLSIKKRIFSEQYTTGIFFKFAPIVLGLSLALALLFYQDQKDSIRSAFMGNGSFLAKLTSFNSMEPMANNDLNFLLEVTQKNFQDKALKRMVIGGIERPSFIIGPMAPVTLVRNKVGEGVRVFPVEEPTLAEKNVKRIKETQAPFFIEKKDHVEFWAPVIFQMNEPRRDYWNLKVYLTEPGELIGYVALFMDKENLNSSLERHLNQSLLLGSGLLLFSLLIVYFMAKLAANPYVRLLEENRAIKEAQSATLNNPPMGTLAMDVGHSIKNVLNLISCNMFIIKQKMADPMVNKKMEEILEAISKGGSLANRLRDPEGKVFSMPRPLDINSHISTATELIRPAVRNGVELETDLAFTNMTVIACHGEMDQLIFNLVNNAWEAMPNGGTITVKTEPMFLSREFLKGRNSGKPGTYAIITVTDTGEGIPNDAMDKIFNPCFSTKEKKGRGLGLWNVFDTLQRRNGFVEVHSEKGKGTTFKIYLPMVE